MEKNYITILDIRHPLQPVTKLSNHKSCVNAMAWAPQSHVHLCSVGDDCQALIWDLNNMRAEITGNPSYSICKLKF